MVVPTLADFGLYENGLFSYFHLLLPDFANFQLFTNAGVT